MMKTDTLFPLPPSHRKSNRPEMVLFKARFGIVTNCMLENRARNWMALSMPAAVKALDGYKLTKDEKTNLFDIVAAYGRLLDECGLLIDGQATEYKAVVLAAEAAAQVL